MNEISVNSLESNPDFYQSSKILKFSLKLVKSFKNRLMEKEELFQINNILLNLATLNVSEEV